MNRDESENLKKQAQEVERSMGLRNFGDCPICDDRIEDRDGLKSCCYCDWNEVWTPEETAERYNSYWAKGRVKAGYEREPKKPEDFTTPTKGE